MVPPNQAELMVEALRRKGLPVAYLAFAGEQHGFRKAETIQTVLRAELAFYGRIFGFAPADGLPDLADRQSVGMPCRKARVTAPREQIRTAGSRAVQQSRNAAAVSCQASRGR